MKNYKNEIRIINIHQGLVINDHITNTLDYEFANYFYQNPLNLRKIVEMVNTLDYEFANCFYQNLLNKAPPIESIQIINLFKVKYEELIEISKKKLKEKSKLKNWYQNQVND